MPTPPSSRHGTLVSIRSFTLIELIVAAVILGIFAAITVVGYTQGTAHATSTARAQLHQPTGTVLVTAHADSTPPLDSALVTSAVEEPQGLQVTDALVAAAPWTLLSATAPPAAGEAPVGSTDTGAVVPGTQAPLGDGTVASSPTVEFTPAPAGEPAPVEPAPVEPAPVEPAPVEPAPVRTPFKSMWVWDNSLTPEQDNRGTSYAAAAPQTIVEFARQNNLSQVHIAAPWVSDEGPIAAWMDETTTALHDAGFEVGVLGGDPGWLDDPSLAVKWALDAISTRPVDYVSLSLEPWTTPSWDADRVGTVARWEATMDAVKAALPAGVELALDAPYWLAWTPAPDGGTLFDAVLERADSLSIVTFVDHAAEFDGIIALSAAARTAADAAGIPYLVGLETDTPAVAGGAAFTFYDDGPEALVREATLVDEALAGNPLYRGIDVEHYRAWRSLLGLA